MKEKLKNFIIKLQNSDEPTKKMWALTGTIISMITITTLWLFTVDLSFDENKIKKEENNPSFSETFSSGLKIVKKEIGGGISKAAEKIKTFAGETKSVNLQAANINFIAESVPEIEPKKLP